MESEDIANENLRNSIMIIAFSLVALFLYLGCSYVHRSEIQKSTSPPYVMIYKSVYPQN